MAIKVALILEGDQAFTAKIADAKKAVNDFVSGIKDTTGAAKVSVTGISDGIDEASKSFAAGVKPANEFRHALYILRPLASELGIQMGNLGMLSRLASVGIGGLLVAGIGAAAVKMTQLQDSVAETKNKLTAFFGSAKEGENIFNQLRLNTGKFGGTVQDTASLLLKFQVAWDKFRTGGPLIVSAPGVGEDPLAKVQSSLKVFEALQKAIMAGAPSVEAGEKAFADFINQFAQGGKVTGDMIRHLQEAGVNVKYVTGLLGGGGRQIRQFIIDLDLSAKTTTDLQMRVGLLGDALEKLPAPPRTLASEWKSLWIELQDLFAGPGFVGTNVKAFFAGLRIEIQALRGGMNTIIESIKTMFSTETWQAAWSQFVADWGGVYQQIIEIFKNPFDLSSWYPIWKSFTDFIKRDAQEAWNWIKQLWSKLPSLPTGFPTNPTQFSTGLQEFARGGPVGGRSGVDQNLALLTKGEFVVRADGSNLTDAIRFFSGDFSSNITRLMRGGIPGFAQGGPVSDGGSRALTLVLEGRRFGVSGNKNTIDALEREAALRGISATGLAPSWVR